MTISSFQTKSPNNKKKSKRTLIKGEKQNNLIKKYMTKALIMGRKLHSW